MLQKNSYKGNSRYKEFPKIIGHIGLGYSAKYGHGICALATSLL